MTAVTREEVSLALFNLLSGSSEFRTASRRFQTWDEISEKDKPALYLVEHKEDHARNRQLIPAVRTTMFDCYLFIASGLDPNIVPMTTLNDLLDAIDPVSGGVLKPGITNKQTLGGLVTDCFIEGEIIKVPGDLDGQGVAIMPIKVVFMDT